MWVLSGAGGSVAAARGSASTARLRSSMRLEQLAQRLGQARSFRAKRPSSSSSSVGHAHRAAPGDRRPVPARSAPVRRSPRTAAAERGRCRDPRRRRAGRAAPAAARWPARRAGARRDRARPGRPAAGGRRRPGPRDGWRPPPRCSPPRERSGTRPPAPGQRPHHRVGVGHEALDRPGLACEHAQRLRGLPQPGWARRSTSLRSSGRPASPAPSSPTMIRRRSTYGRRTMLFTRSSGMVEVVCSTGTRPPSGIRSLEVPGWHCTKYSPMNDCGRISQCASRRRSAKPGSVISTFTTASGCAPPRTSRSPVVPARTPATLKSPPPVTPEGVVELDLVAHALRVVVVAWPPRARAVPPTPAASAGPGRRGSARHGPTDRWESSHWREACSAAESTFEPSGAGGFVRARAAPVLTKLRSRSVEELRQVDPGPRVLAERVIGACGGEVVEPAHEVRRVRPPERESRGCGTQRGGRLGEGPAAHGAVHPCGVECRARELREAPQRLDQVVAVPRGANRPREIADRGRTVPREPAGLGEKRLQPCRHRLRGGHERVHVVERGPEVHEGRVGAPQERRQPLDGFGQRRFLSAERGEGGAEAGHGTVQLAAPLPERGHELRGIDQDATQQPVVPGQHAEQPRPRGQSRVEVVDTRAQLRPASLQRRGRPRHHILERRARPFVEDVEDLVDLHGRAGVVGVDAAAVVDLVAVIRAELEIDVAVGDPGQRAQLHHRLRAGPERHVLLVTHLERHLGHAVLGDVDLLDGADLGPGHAHLVAAHELTGVLKLRRDAVARSAEERDGQDGGHGEHQRPDREGPFPGSTLVVRPGRARARHMQVVTPAAIPPGIALQEVAVRALRWCRGRATRRSRRCGPSRSARTGAPCPRTTRSCRPCR